MNQRDLQPASALVQRYGVKGIFYGPPGSGKTPIVQSAPRPLMLVCEPGLLSMRTSVLPCYLANTGPRIAEFFEWFFNSREADQFDTLAMDSGSQLAEIVLAEQFLRNKDGRKAYGEMSNICMKYFDGLFYMPNKHIYIIAKEGHKEYVESAMIGGVPTITTIRKAEPYFPGQDLPMKISHRFDLICQVNKGDIPGLGRQQYIRTKESSTVTARDRSGKLEEFEPPDLTALFKKAMS